MNVYSYNYPVIEIRLWDIKKWDEHNLNFAADSVSNSVSVT